MKLLFFRFFLERLISRLVSFPVGKEKKTVSDIKKKTIQNGESIFQFPLFRAFEIGRQTHARRYNKKKTYLWIRRVDGGHHHNQKAHADDGNSSWFLHPWMLWWSRSRKWEADGLHHRYTWVQPTNWLFSFTPGCSACVCVSTTTSNVER